MNKNIKRIIAMTLTVGALSAVGKTDTGLFMTAANASTANAEALKDLKLTTSSGGSLNLYEDSDYGDELLDDLEVDKTYYSKTSSRYVVIDSINGIDEDNVRIFKNDSDTAYEVDDSIKIPSETTTTLRVRIYEEDYDENKEYDSSDYNQYTIKLENTEDENNISLSNLKLSDGYIKFYKNDTSYEVKVALDMDSITVQAIPENKDYKVQIDGTTVEDDDDYKKIVSLNDENTTIKVIVSDSDDNTKTYNLEVVRTDNLEETDKGNNGLNLGWRNKNSNGNNGRHLGWRNENGAWHYFDNEGKKKQGWFKDNDQSWYFLDNLGKMKVGWYKDIDENWYYLGSNGKMKTSWIKDTDGNWYYLQPSGKMAKNTTIDGYKIGTNGAWVKK